MKTLHNIARRWSKPTVGLFLLAGSAYCGEYAVLSNGFRLHADRHEVAGNQIRLFEKGGVSEMAASDVAAFEPEEWSAPTVGNVGAAPAAAPGKPIGDLYALTAKRHGLPEALVRSIVKAESNGNPRAVSKKGAIGLMQLMPGTARELGVDPAVPEQNVDAGTRYLKSLLARYEDQDDQVARAVAAYNAGPGAIDKYKGVPPYRETQTYVRRVLTDYLRISNQ